MPAKNETSAPVYRRFRILLLSMMPLVALTVYLYGVRPLMIVGIAAVLAVLSDLLVAAMRRRPYEARDLSSILLAVTFALMLSAAIRYEIVIIGTAVTLLMKHAFGGYSGCVFQPAAFGFAVSAICWPAEMFRYPSSFSHIGMGFESGAVLYDAPAYIIRNNGIPTIDRMDLLLGDYPGPMGATFCVVLIAILLFLVAVRVTSFHVLFTYLASVAVFAFAFPRIPATRMESVMFEMISGIVIYGAVYIISDPVTTPVNVRAKLIYGMLLGIATMIFSHYGAFQMGVCFAVLLVNPLASWLDRKCAPRHASGRGKG